MNYDLVLKFQRSLRQQFFLLLLKIYGHGAAQL